MNTNKTSLEPKYALGPELDLTKVSNEDMVSKMVEFLNTHNPPCIIFTNMTDEAPTIMREFLDEQTNFSVWERWGHNQWRIKE